MISEFRIKRFKLFHDVSFPHLTPITLIGGKNNTGKSSFLEALFLYYDRFSAQMALRHMTWRGIRKYAANPDGLFAPLFFDFDTSQPLSLAATEDGKKKGLMLSVKPAEHYSRVNVETVYEKPEQSSAKQTESSSAPDTFVNLEYSIAGKKQNKGSIRIENGELTLKLEKKVDSQTATTTYIGTRANSSPQQDAERFGRLDLMGQADTVTEILAAIDPQIKSLSAIPLDDGSTLIHADIGLSKKVPINFLGDGVTRVFSILMAMSHARGGITLVDDIDSGLHHSTLTQVWSALASASKRFNSQLIATTHNRECISAAFNSSADLFGQELSYVRFDRTGNSIKTVPYDASALQSALDHELETR